MRRRFLIVLAAVLLLRGWFGVAMAGQMLAHELQPPAASAVATMVHGPDCQGMAFDDEDAAAAQDYDGMCGSCLHCEDCTLHALVATNVPIANVLPEALASTGGIRFASAEPRTGFKPPIS